MPTDVGHPSDDLGFLHFYSPPDDGLEPTFAVTHHSGSGQKNYSHKRVLVGIRDIRGRERSFSLGTHSFLAVSRKIPPLPPKCDEESLKEVYAQDAVDTILKEVESAAKVTVFDTTIRRATPSEAFCRPVRKVHIDQTPRAAMLRAEKHLTWLEARAVIAGRRRIRLINVWRPLRGAVEDHPLAFAESQTLAQTDLVTVKHIYPDSVGETYAVKYNLNQCYRYWSKMRANEALLLQCYDSLGRQGEVGRLHAARCAHASFVPLLNGNDDYNRESVEVRCLVLDEDVGER